jgi:hypothetical protein
MGGCLIFLYEELNRTMQSQKMVFIVKSSCEICVLLGYYTA